MPSRVSMTFRNAFWSYFSMIASVLISFVSRTVFIYYLGENYLGINGLFSNVLGVLSFAELGIGTAIGFSLYKPVAEHNVEKIKSYMYYYKWAYRIIGGIVAALGLALLPFLDKLVKDPGNVGDVRIYYLIYLFNTVSSYFVSYKFSLVNAEQKNYIFTNVNLILSLTTTAVQILALVLWQNYLWYLLVAAAFGLFQKIFTNIYLNKMYPYLREKHVAPLLKEEKQTLFRKIKALVLVQIGDTSVYQTDNIIISFFEGVRTVGLLSNYNLIISTISGGINVLFGAAKGSLGNLVATESRDHQYEVFKAYRFVAFWLYGFSSIALLVLLTPFITLWVGENMVVDDVVIGLIVLNYYMLGHRACLYNMKASAGIFEQDQYIDLTRGVINLVASIAMVKWIGLPGVYVGTIIQGAVMTIAKPILIYRTMFGISSKYYFIDSLKYGLAVAVGLVICWELRLLILPTVTIGRFIIVMALVAIIPNAVFFLCFRKREEFQYAKRIVNQLLEKGKEKLGTKSKHAHK